MAREQILAYPSTERTGQPRCVGHGGSCRKAQSGAEVEQDAFWARCTTVSTPWRWAACPTKHCVERCGCSFRPRGLDHLWTNASHRIKPLFDPEAGQLCDFEANAGAWRLSPGTVKVLQSLVREDDESSHEPEAWAKSARLLAAWSSRILGEASILVVDVSIRFAGITGTLRWLIDIETGPCPGANR